MAIRIIVYGVQGDGTAYSAMSQIRSLVNEMGVDCNVDIVTNEQMLRSNGIEDTPSVYVDGLMVATGYAPSRMQMKRAIEQRLAQLNPNRVGNS